MPMIQHIVDRLKLCEYVDKIVVATSDEISDDILAEYNTQMADFNAKQYQRDRQPEYPDLKSQLDMLYHDIKDNKLDSGTWIAAVEAIKTKYPKS